MITTASLTGSAPMLTAVEFLDPRAADHSGAAGWYRHAAPQLDVWAGDGLVAGARPDVTASLPAYRTTPRLRTQRASLAARRRDGSHRSFEGHLLSPYTNSPGERSAAMSTRFPVQIPTPVARHEVRRPELRFSSRYRCREALEVRARDFDGSRRAVVELTDWVAHLGGGRYACTGRAESHGWVLLVEDPDAGTCVELQPREVLVWTRSSARWTTCSREQFTSWFEPAPRELPIYSDREVGE